MQLDWTTFVLEILNFLVLVWILQRFLYRPVLDLIAARQQKIAEETALAQNMRVDAEALRRQYESRLADWQQACERSRRELDEQLALLKHQEMTKLKQALADEAEKMRIRNQTALNAREAELLRDVAGQAYGEAASMLQRLASPELTQHIAALFIEDLQALPEHDQTLLQKAGSALKDKEAIAVVSAHPLPEAVRAALEAALQAAGRCTAKVQCSEDPGLIAGLCAIVGECELRAALADELEFFRRRFNHVR